jgi:hypothetical protein
MTLPIVITKAPAAAFRGRREKIDHTAVIASVGPALKKISAKTIGIGPSDRQLYKRRA